MPPKGLSRPKGLAFSRATLIGSALMPALLWTAECSSALRISPCASGRRAMSPTRIGSSAFRSSTWSLFPGALSGSQSRSISTASSGRVGSTGCETSFPLLHEGLISFPYAGVKMNVLNLRFMQASISAHESRSPRDLFLYLYFRFSLTFLELFLILAGNGQFVRLSEGCASG
jgi:hypothetical protein